MIFRLSGIFEGRGLSTPVIALTNVTGVPFAVMSGLQGGGSAAYEAVQLGKDPLTQLAYGTAEGVLTGGIEALSGLGASAALKSTVGKALAKVAPKAAAWLTRVGESVAGKLFLSGAGEGWEEFIQYPGDKLLARIFLNDESPYDVKEQAYGALMASILGALMSAPGAVSESGMAKQERDNIAAAARAANEFADTTYQSLKLTPPTRLDPARATAEDVEKHFRDIQKVVTAQAEVERQQTNEAMRRAGLSPELARLTENMTPVQTQPSGTTTPPAASSVPADILPLTQSIKSGLVPDARSAQLPSETARLLDTVGRRIGVRVVIGAPEASMGANGWYGNGQLVIAQDAANPLVVVLKHEVTHRMQEAAPEEYNLFRNYAARQMALRRFGGRLDAGISNYQQRYAQKGRTLTPEGALDEMAADYTEYLMTNPGDFEAVAQDNRTLARRLFESLRQVLRNIKAAFTGNTARNRAALEQTGRSYTQLQEGLTLWENALRATEQVTRTAQDLRTRGAVVQTNENTAGIEPAAQYMIRRTQDGTSYVDVTTDQHLFDGKTPTEMQVIAKKEILRRFKQQVIGGDNRAFVTKRGAEEYAYPRAWLANGDIKEGKMRASTELDNLLAASTYVRHETDDGHHPDAVGGWDYFDTVFKVGSRVFQGEVQIMNNARGKMFHDITKIKDITRTSLGLLVTSTSADRTGNAFGTTVPQTGTGVKENLRDDGRKFSLREPVEEKRNLIAVHNLEEEDLRGALELGGMPSPSIAIVKAQHGHTGFGGISLVFDKRTIDPAESRANRVYGGDAWTPTAPAVSRPVNEKVAAAFEKEMQSLAKSFAGGMFERDVLSTMGGAGLEYGYTINTIDSIATNFAHRDGIVAAYLAAHGKTVEPVRAEKEYTFGEDITRKFVEEVGAQELARLASELAVADHRQTYLETSIVQAANDFLEKNQAKKPTVSEFRRNMRAKNLIHDAWDYFQASPAQISASETAKKMRELYQYEDVKAWVASKLEGLLGEPGIRNNRDTFTPSGKRRSFSALHSAYTLENIMKAMYSRQRGRGAGAMGASPSALRAVTAPEYKSIKQIKADSNRLMREGDEAYGEKIADVSERIHQLLDKISSTNKPKYGNNLTEISAIADVLMDAAQGRRTVDAIVLRFKESGYTISNTTAQEIQALYKAAASLPTDLFEAKPRRAVGFDEVRAAIVPNNMDADLAAALEKQGVPVYTYEEGERAEVVNRAADENDVKFSLKDDGQTKAPVFYSQLERTIESYKGGKLSTQGLESFLRSRGVKEEEIKWSGILQYAEGKKSLDKAELLKFVRANDLRIEETETEANRFESIDNYPYATREDAREDVEEKAEINYYTDAVVYEFDGEPMYTARLDTSEGTWKVETGGLYTFDEDPDIVAEGLSEDDALEVLFDYRRESIESELDEIEYSDDRFTRYGPDSTHEDRYMHEGGENYREVLFRLPGLPGRYKNEHWAQDDVIAHTRLQDFTGENGESVLLVDEVQSDWHQEGLKKGYGGKDGVPDAPFRKTWHEFVMKRVLRMAADGDYDAIVWPTGAEQADRYNFGGVVSEITIMANSDINEDADRYSVTSEDRGGNRIAVGTGRMSAEKIYNTFGKDLGGRMIKSADENAPQLATISGEDLRIGGEGMRNFYDIGGKSSQNIPRWLNKYLKQWGASVSEIELDTGETLPGVRINDAMRESVLYEGQPKYSLKDDTAGGDVGADVEAAPGAPGAADVGALLTGMKTVEQQIAELLPPAPAAAGPDTQTAAAPRRGRDLAPEDVNELLTNLNMDPDGDFSNPSLQALLRDMGEPEGVQWRKQDANRAGNLPKTTTTTVVRDLVKNNGVDMRQKDITPQLDAIYSAIEDGTTGDPAAQIRALAGRIADETTTQINQLADDYAEVRKDLRTVAVTLAPEDRDNLPDGYNYFRKKNMGTLRLTNRGMAVDERYHELAAIYPGLFDTEITDPASQLMEMADVAARVKPVFEPVSGDERAYIEANIARQIWEGYFKTRAYRLQEEGARALASQEAARQAEEVAKENKEYWNSYTAALADQGSEEEKGRPPRSTRRIEESIAEKTLQKKDPRDVITDALRTGGADVEEEAARILLVPTDDTAIAIGPRLKGNRAGIFYQTSSLERILDNAAGGDTGLRKALGDLLEDPIRNAANRTVEAVIAGQDDLYKNVVKKYGIRKGSKESAAVQWIGEGKKPHKYTPKQIEEATKKLSGLSEQEQTARTRLNRKLADIKQERANARGRRKDAFDAAKQAERYSDMQAQKAAARKAFNEAMERQEADWKTAIGEFQALKQSLDKNIEATSNIVTGVAEYTMDDLKKEFPNTWKNIVKAEQWFKEQYTNFIDSINNALETIYPEYENSFLARLEAAQSTVEGFQKRIDRAEARKSWLETELDKRAAKSAQWRNPDKYKAFKAKTAQYAQELKEIGLSMGRMQAGFEAAEKRYRFLKKDYDSGDYLLNKRLTPRGDYFHHFREMTSGSFQSIINAMRSRAEIDPRLVSISEYTKPNSRFTGFLQHRGDGTYQADAVDGFLRYLDDAAYKIHMEPVIPRLRAVTRDIANATVDTKNANGLIQYLTDFTNDLAGKTHRWDRVFQTETGRKFIRVAEALNNRAKANAILFSATSAIAQISNLPNALALLKNPLDWAAGTVRFASALVNPEVRAAMKKSPFLRERYDIGRSAARFDRFGPMTVANFMLQFGDEAVTRMVWNMALVQAMRTNQANPITYADNLTRRAVAGRGIAEMPLAQKSHLVRLLAPFQVEVQNSYNLFKDIFKEGYAGIKTGDIKKVGGAAWQLSVLFGASWLLNNLIEAIIGRRVVFDPIDAIARALPKDGEEKTMVQTAGSILANLLGEFVSNIPGGEQLATVVTSVLQDNQVKSVFGDEDPTRYGVGAVGTTAILKLGGSLMDAWIHGKPIDDRNVQRAAGDLLATLGPPAGGRQIKRAVDFAQDAQLIPNLLTGMQPIPGSYSGGDGLRFPISKDPGNLLAGFAGGAYATREGKEYIQGGRLPLSDTATAKVEAAAKLMPLQDAYDLARILPQLPGKKIDKVGAVWDAAPENPVTALRLSDIFTGSGAGDWPEGLSKQAAAAMKKIVQDEADTKILNWEPEEKTSHRGREYELTTAERDKWAASVRETATKDINRLVGSSEWSKSTSTDRRKKITRILEDAKEAAKQSLVESRGDRYFQENVDVERFDTMSQTISEFAAYDIMERTRALTPEPGKKTVSPRQRYEVLMESNITDEEKAEIFVNMYTTDGAGLLSDVDAAGTLIKLFNETGETSYISMSVPNTFTENKVEYEYTDEDKALYRREFLKAFNRVPLPESANLRALKTRVSNALSTARERARAAVIRARRQRGERFRPAPRG